RELLTTAERVEMKRRELLPNYLPTAQRYLDEGEVYSNPIFVYCVIWLFDIGEFDQGLDWADMQCLPMPETHHALTVTLFVANMANYSQEQIVTLKTDISNLIRCAFRENADYGVKKTWPYSRFSFSNLGREIHREFTEIESLTFSLGDIL
ncbi:phage terminase small subunit, partial [Xenorhabdus entomophaga]|uniref:phage terminase small subunit n=1 Tax=Xenorhabdus entomophaga TaxID=3136257 RepID=UPI0030F49316